MTPGARLQAVIDVLAEIAVTPRPADAVASAWFRARRFIGAKDRSAVAEKVYAVLRAQARLGWWLERAGCADPAAARMRVIAHSVLVEGKRVASVERLFDGGGFSPAVFTPDETRVAYALDQHTLDHPQMPDPVRVECPAWAEPGLRRSLGGRFVPELMALTGSAPLDLRVNPVRATREQVLAGLEQAGIVAEACRLSPLGVRVQGRPAIAPLELFKAGAIEIQDEGSQLVALLVEGRPGHQVVDFCAGAGGKALAIAAAMANRGRVVATDVLGNRLKRAAERLRRAGLHNVETRELSGARDKWVKRHKGHFDRVLVDAPCSGTGTWRRNPDSRWRPLGPGLEKLVPLQAEILDSAARLVKSGGRLVYATCSLLAEENEDQIAQFLASHTEFSPLPVQTVWSAVIGGNAPGEGPWLRLSPARHDTDGFFVAILERAAVKAATAAAPETVTEGVTDAEAAADPAPAEPGAEDAGEPPA